MIAWLGVLLAVAGLAAYFAVATRFAVRRRVPWEYIAVTAAGDVLSTLQFFAAPSIVTGSAALASTAVLAFSLRYYLGYSMLGRREERPAVGDESPDFSLEDSTGGFKSE